MVWNLSISLAVQLAGGNSWRCRDVEVGGGADRLGWNAMPFARDDLDSNYSTGQ